MYIMAQDDETEPNVPTATTLTTTQTVQSGPPGHHDPKKYDDYNTDTVAAVTIAVLAVVIVITLLLILRVLRKRRRARQGDQFGTNSQIHTVTTGVMGTGSAAYGSSINAVPVRGAVTWESVNPAGAESSHRGAGRGDDSTQR